MRKFKVYFEAEETAWNSCFAVVEAESAEEAYKMVEDSIENSNPFADFDASWNGINTVTTDVIETNKYGIGEDYGVGIDDVEDITDEISVELEFSAFDLMRLGKDAVYQAVEQELDGIEALDMEMTPVGVRGDVVIWKCRLTDWRKPFEVEVRYFNGDSQEPYEVSEIEVFAKNSDDALKKAEKEAKEGYIAARVESPRFEMEVLNG